MKLKLQWPTNDSVEQFLARHWQRRPFVWRQALPSFEAPLTASALFELAADDAAPSRLIERRGGRWQLRHGPFAARDLPKPATPGWTLLVQAVDTCDDRIRRLLDLFRFIPDARLDDLMISYASAGGGVGAHTDSYDVFLLQAQGTRRWRIGPVADPVLQLNRPLKLLANFRATEQYDLRPGDILYLPPAWGHDGRARGADCMTYSIGFRAPSAAELLRAFLADAAEQAYDDAHGRFRDAKRAPSRHPAALPEDLIEFAVATLGAFRPTVANIEDFLGRWLSEPREHVVFDRPARPMTAARFARAAALRGLRLDRRCRMLYRGKRLFINGESVNLSGPPGDSVHADRTTGAAPDQRTGSATRAGPAANGQSERASGDQTRRSLRRLADQRRLSAADCRGLSHGASLQSWLYPWYLAGWLHLDSNHGFE